MEMKIIFAMIVVAATMSFAMATGPAAGAAHAPSDIGTAPAPGPASAAVYSALPAFGSLLGASFVTLFSYYFQ